MNPTPEQQLAIDTKGINIIVSAGAGSGKTAVLTQRTMRIINDGIHINELLILTFTKAAATEMKERFLRLMDGKNYPVTFGTFHAVFFAILKHAYHYSAENIVREEQRVQCMREIVAKHKLEYEDEDYQDDIN